MVRSGAGRVWYLAFHALFFLDLYLSSEGVAEFHPPPPFGLGELEPMVVLPEQAYGKDELLRYLKHCRKTHHGLTRSDFQRTAFRYSLSPIICGAEKTSNVGVTAYPDDFSALLAGVSHHR